MSGGLFSYENPIMQILMYIGDLIILNFLFLICSVPIFTIGAAQAGMYTAMRVLRDKEDDSSVTAAFFRGFKNGFGKVTIAWGVMTLVTLLVAYVCVCAYAMELPVWICIIPVVLLAWLGAQVTAIHSRFDCKVLELIRNCWFLCVSHPLRTLGVTIFTWLPLVVFLLDGFTFLSLVPAWCIIYFSLAYLFNQTFLAKPFDVMVKEFNKRQAQQQGEENAADTESTQAEVPVE